MKVRTEELIAAIRTFQVHQVAGPHRPFGFWPDVAQWMQETEERLGQMEEEVAALHRAKSLTDAQNPL